MLDFIFYPDFMFISWESFMNFFGHSMMNQILHFETNFPGWKTIAKKKKKKKGLIEMSIEIGI